MITLEKEPEKVTQKGTYTLIDGLFDPQDALEITNDLLLKKINFHQFKNFSQKVKYGLEDTDSDKRIAQLDETRRNISDFITEARKNGNTLKISSTIIIEKI